jgi:hypothetical protein
MAKAPVNRYPGCRELAEDLRRFLADEPIRARHVGLVERFVRWCRRSPAIAALAGISGLLLLAVAVAATVGYVQTSAALKREADERQRAETERERAETHRKLAERDRMQADLERKHAERQLHRSEWLLYASQIAAAQREWTHGDPGLAWHYLNACRWDRRGWEHDYLYALMTSGQETLFGHRGRVHSVAFSLDGQRIVSGSEDQTLKMWDAVKGQPILSFKGHTGQVRSVAFSPDGQRIVSGSWSATPSFSGDQALKVWVLPQPISR